MYVSPDSDILNLHNDTILHVIFLDNCNTDYKFNHFKHRILQAIWHKSESAGNEIYNRIIIITISIISLYNLLCYHCRLVVYLNTYTPTFCNIKWSISHSEFRNFQWNPVCFKIYVTTYLLRVIKQYFLLYTVRQINW